MVRKTSKVSETPKRGYHLHSESKKYVKNGYTLLKCNGEAHSNAFIDNCGSCLGSTWGWKVVHNINRRDLGELMQHWHSSQNDPIYAVGSYYYAGAKHPNCDVVNSALDNLFSLRNQNQRMLIGEKVKAPTAYGTTDDLKKFAGYNDKELKENIKELDKIIECLQMFMKEDY